MYLEKRRQLEKALYLKAVGIPKQACYRCILRDRLKIVNLSDGSSCLPGKENVYCGDFCCVASQCKANFKTQMGTGKFKRIINKFSLSGKRRKEPFS